MATFNSFDALKKHVNKEPEETTKTGDRCPILICINPFNYNWRETKSKALATAGLEVKKNSFTVNSTQYEEVEYILHFSRPLAKRYFKKSYTRNDIGGLGPQQILMDIYRYLIHRIDPEKEPMFQGPFSVKEEWNIEWSTWEKNIEKAIQEYLKLVQDK